MRSLRIVGLVVVVAALVLGAAQAGASPRGVNGQITYDRTTDPTTGAKEILIANPDGSNERVLVPTDPFSCCADFSPDGSKLAFGYLTGGGRVATAMINADGTGRTPFPIDDPTLNFGCGTGSWSPDGRRLACESFGNTNPARDGIYTVSSVDGSDLTRVTNSHGLEDIPGSYSPNGKRLVFGRFRANGYAVGLFVINSDGTHLRRLTPPGAIIQVANAGAWSPEGNEIIFYRHVTRDVLGSIWVIHANGTGLHEIHIQGLDCGASFSDPNAAGCHMVRWSPDGKKIIFSAVTAPGFNIYTANANGTGLHQVTFDGNDDDPAWGTHPLMHPAAGFTYVHSRISQATLTPAQRGMLQILAGITQSGESLGRSTARVIVKLYGDLECPLCRHFVLSRAFARLISTDVRTGKVRIVYRSLCTATCNGGDPRVFVSQQVAAYAAGGQRRFWQYAMLFLQQQGTEGTNYVTGALLDRLAHEVPGLSFVSWVRARKNPALAGEVKNEDRSASQQNISTTPTLIVTGPHGVRELIGVSRFQQISAALTEVS